MGESSQEISANNSGGEINGLGACKAHRVSISPQEDRRRSAGEVGEVQGGAKEEGGLGLRGPMRFRGVRVHTGIASAFDRIPQRLRQRNKDGRKPV